jgi:hypothetical protein
MLAVVVVGGIEVRVLDDSDEWEPGIVDVEPVRIRQASIELEDEADVPEVAHATEPRHPPGVRLAVEDVGDDRQRWGENETSGVHLAAGRGERLDGVPVTLNPGDGRAVADLAARPKDRFGDLLRERAEAALEVGELLATLLVARAAARTSSSRTRRRSPRRRTPRTSSG